MSKLIKDGFLRLGIAVALLAPTLLSAQINPCGQPGQPACPMPEPHSWALVGLAIGLAMLVTRISRK